VLQGDRLLVIVEGALRRIESRVSPMLSDDSTHVRLYKIVDKSAGVLELVSTSDLTGYFSGDVQTTVDGKAHVVTTSGVDRHTDLVDPFDMNKFQGMTTAEYLDATKKLAEETAIPNVVNGIMAELRSGRSPTCFASVYCSRKLQLVRRRNTIPTRTV
jgi:hypothetical protein